MVRNCLLVVLEGCGSQAGAGGGLSSADSGPTTQPIVLVTLDAARSGGSSLAVDSTYLYFSPTNSVQRLALAGGTPATVATGIHGPIVLDASHVYGFDATGIVSVPKTGGTPTSVTKGSRLGEHLAVEATRIYFPDYYGLRTNGDNYYPTIFSPTPATGTMLNIPTQQYITGPFARDDTNLYWFSDNLPNGEVRLMSVAKSGGTATTLTSGGGGIPDGPAFDGTRLYWTTSGGWTAPIPPSTLRALPATGGAPTLLASPDQPRDLAA